MTVPLKYRKSAFWDAVYSASDASFLPIDPGETFRFQDRTDAAPGQIAVDVGTGLGEWACQMSRLGLAVTAYDYSSVAIERARQLHAQHGAVTYEVHDFDADPIPRPLQPGTVGIITCRHVLNFLEPRFVADARRWLHKDGILHVTTAVTQRIRDGRGIGMPEEEVRELARGWREWERYDLDPHGEITVMLLRGPYI
ncbi:class I SAM-dependent methyltransferase [Streptomyces sp. NBC_01077]|uniref:class I SAM-dependent methyltransferase n=1 Tax=Streptomyces sp. NBC_01077 TaxID=2903746 RepID=UPI00386E8A14|nr:class I SAM-dependent methyltransferase [Streptomyces sp. NBC_01077]WSV43440.1 class I SAM-dependent methyltransferase [Streptomyces sp. NBC_01077]